jgi:hypothetical protein
MLKDELWERRLQKDKEQCLEKETEVTQPSFLFSVLNFHQWHFDAISIFEPNKLHITSSSAHQQAWGE